LQVSKFKAPNTLKCIFATIALRALFCMALDTKLKKCQVLPVQKMEFIQPDLTDKVFPYVLNSQNFFICLGYTSPTQTKKF
jgi:hypothetical protein